MTIRGENLSRIKALIPSVSGEQFTANQFPIWYAAQHADQFPEFQDLVFERFADWEADTRLDARLYAKLSDERMVRDEDKQTLGTFYRCTDSGQAQLSPPIVDLDDAESRRSRLGLPPLDEYLAEKSKSCAK